MKKRSSLPIVSFLFLLTGALLVVFGLFSVTASAQEAQIEPCLNCHEIVTPGIVKQWQDSKHSGVDVGCYTCHEAKAEDPSGYDHNGFTVTAVPSPGYCAGCHPKEVEQNSVSKHAWGAFMGPLKLYYIKAREAGLDPVKQETAKQLDPEKMAKTALTPLFPDSGILGKIGLLDDPQYNHNNVNLGCIECHGSFIIAEPGGKLKGWPNAGVGRINPDGSLGSCTYCHTRHKFSVAEARKPETCGQCHLGPDHPQYEIYEESKHGNIYAASGESWNWDAPSGQWGPEDIVAPTCATCHISGFGGVVETNHDVGSRLYWELQPKKSVPQWKGPDEVDMVIERVPDEAKAEKGRERMEKVCYQCHSRQWADNYLGEFDTVVKDYNMLWEYTDNLLKQAYEEGLISKDNPLDETPEIMHYLIWHHDGRRWRMGASMMGPDWTHWNGAVDAIMNKLGTMVNDIETRRKFKALEAKIEMLPGTAEGKVTLAINKGLNMISLPLKPETPYTALTLAERLGATTVIKLDESQQRFVGFTIAQGTDGFPIESGKGYIVNVPQTKKVVFTGTMWSDEAPSAAPAIEENTSVWAFVVSGSLANAPEDDIPETLTVWARNLRTGMMGKDVISPEENGSFAIVLADLNLNPVVNLGDELEIFATNTRGEVVSSQPSYHIQPEDLRRAYAHRIFDLSLRIPKANALWQNYPNPFNPETWIPFQLSESADVKINIYDVSGKLIKTIDLGHRQAGIYLDKSTAAFWNGRTETGEQAASGIYFYQIKAGEFTQARKMILAK